jgi:signal transduction histidine kinase
MEHAKLADRTKSEFLANVSHELRTPLNAIIGFSEMMEREVFGPLGADQYKEYIHDIRKSGTCLLEIINDILDLSKIETGELELREEAIDPDSLIEKCLRVVKPHAKTGGVELSEQFDSGLPAIRADERKFKQILINLLSNAVKFTEEGGKVYVSAEIDESRGLVISVIDTGIGIAADDIPVILMPFGQADSSLARKYEGTGLGLPLTKSLIEMHGGALELESVLGTGTTVTVNFPPHRIIAKT